MRILITNHRLNRRGGTQAIIRDLAVGLREHGHSVIAYSSVEPTPGDSLADDSVATISRLDALPFVPDIIHGHHHLDAMTAILALPGVPAIYCCHGATEPEKQPRHPRIVRYVAITPTLRFRMASESGIDEAAIEVIPNAVDLRRFREIRNPPDIPRRAAVYSSIIGPDSPISREFRGAADQAGLELEFLGARARARPVSNPQEVLLGYDIVFASGKSAIDALACGCAVIVLSSTSCGEMVCGDNFDRLRDANFAIPVNSPPPSMARILAEVRRYSAVDVAATSRRLRQVAGLDGYIDRFVAIYEKAIDIQRRAVPDRAGERRAALGYLRSIAPWIEPFDGLPAGQRLPMEIDGLLKGAAGQLAALRAEDG